MTRAAAVAVALALLTACGSGSEPAARTSPSATASATPPPSSPAPSPSASDDAFERCGDQPTTVDMVECFGEELKDADRRVAAALAAARRTLGAEGQRALDESQVHWLRYRTATCQAAAASYEGGSFAAVEELACLWGRADHRLEELTELAEEG